MVKNRRRDLPPQEEHIRPEVHEQVHRKERPKKESPARRSKANRIFWTVMVFFFISGAAYFLDQWING